MKKNNILIIKHGALGDIVLSGAAIKAIRNFHKKDNIYCLTTKTYCELMEESPWFDEVIVDEKPKWNNISGWLCLRSTLQKLNFSRIYDLQTSNRSNLYFYLFFFMKSVQWSGIAYGCTFRHNNSIRKKMHTYDRQKDQLSVCGLRNLSPPDWKWLLAKNIKLNIVKDKYALIISGSAAHRKNKIWPKESYAELVKVLKNLGISSVFIGLEGEKTIIDEIISNSEDSSIKKSINLVGKTSFKDIAFLAKSAQFVIGNDTGPIHLAASCEAKVVVLFGAGSNPKLCAPIGENVTIMYKEDIKNILVNDVLDQIKKFL